MDAKTGSPVPDATVHVLQWRRYHPWSSVSIDEARRVIEEKTVTDESGTFALDPGTDFPDLLVTTPGYASRRIARVASGRFVRVELEAAASVHGNLEPLVARYGAGLSVALRMERLSYPEVPVGPDGGFRFEGVSPGSGVLRVERGNVEVRTRRLTVGPGEEHEIRFDLARGPRIRGRATRGDEPASGVQLWFHELHEGADVRESATVWTGADGRYEVTGLPAGTYRVWATWTERDQRKPLMVELASSDVRLDVAFPRGILEGTLRSPNGDPLPRARVTAYREERAGGLDLLGRPLDRDRWLPEGSSATDDEGRYELTDLPRGRYVLLAEKHTWGPVDFDGESLTHDLQMSVPGSFEVVVRDAETGAPVEDAWIAVLSPQEVWLDSGNSDAKGSWVTSELPPAAYRVRVSRRHGRVLLRDFVFDPGANPRLEVDYPVRPNLRVRVPGAASIGPQPYVLLELERSDHTWFSSVLLRELTLFLDEEGRTVAKTQHFPPGHYELRARVCVAESEENALRMGRSAPVVLERRVRFTVPETGEGLLEIPLD